MGIIDRLLDLLGLQRKQQQEVQIVAEPIQANKKPESAFEVSSRRQREVAERIVNAATELTATMYESRAIAMERLTKMLREGSYNETEFNQLYSAVFTNFGVDSPELSDEIKQALREALEKRGKENEEDQGNEEDK